MKGAECSSNANVVQKNSHKFKEKNSVQQNTTYKKKGKKKDKKRDGCFTCGSDEHWANKCPNKYKKPAQDSKSVNVTLSNNDAASGYGNLFAILSVCQSTNWWIDTGANIHVCADVSLFSSYQVARDCSVLMGNG